MLKDSYPLNGKFGVFGGKYVPELIIPALEELEEAYNKYAKDEDFNNQLNKYLRDYAGRPTPLYHAENLSKLLGFKVYLKREDLLHTGSHKLNNALGQAFLAKKMGKTCIVSETGAGQHGIAVATAGVVFGLKTIIFMGAKDVERQRLNVFRMKLLGAELRIVEGGVGILKDAVNEAVRYWTANLSTTHYLLGSSVGPHPYPMIVRNFQRIIGKEAKSQVLEREGRLPDALVACGSGGSNAIGLFYEFLDDDVKMYFVEGGGEGVDGVEHAAVLTKGEEGVLHGAYTYILQDEHGQVNPSKTRAAGLNYPARGPEISFLRSIGRVEPVYVTDRDAIQAFRLMCQVEGLMPALETAHAIAFLLKRRELFARDDVVLVNFSGRGEKDLDVVMKYSGEFDEPR